MREKKIQEFLFQRIREMLPPNRSLAETVAEVLCVSPDSAYRRIRSETPLVLEEAQLLCRQFNISLDQLLELSGNSVVFQTTKFAAQPDSFAGFLEGILADLRQVESFSEKNIIYVCKDIPLFHQLCAREVLAFRYFFWMRNVFEHAGFLRQPFSAHHLTPEVEELAREVYATYCKIPSIEIWSVESINGLLLQIQYYRQTGLLSKEAMLEVGAGLRRILKHLQVQAAYGCKFLPGENPRSKKENFQIFYNRQGVAGNTILTTCEGKRKVYLNYEALSYIDTMDEDFCKLVYEQLQNNIRRSTLISSVSEKQRNMFFNLLYAKLPEQEINNEKIPP